MFHFVLPESPNGKSKLIAAAVAAIKSTFKAGRKRKGAQAPRLAP